MGHEDYTKPCKIVIIVHLENSEAEKVFGTIHGFKVCMGARYIGSYTRNEESKSDWMRECMLTWEKKIGMIRKIVGKYP